MRTQVDPHRGQVVVRVTGTHHNQRFYQVRRGTYRILYRIDDQDMTVTVLAVGPRSDIYRTD